jgi:hypothetical protein
VELTSILRKRFEHVGFIIPHVAMSAATILVMSADEILMDHRSSLGPIDPQYVGNDGRPQPAQAILTGIETIKKSIDENKGVLHPAYIPILRNVDPGRLQSAIDASDLSKRIVTEYLIKYKFRNWTQHKSTGLPVTSEERKSAATRVAKILCDHQRWLSHSHPIKIAELRDMGIRINDYGDNKELQDAIWSLWVHYHHFVSGTNTYKTYESKSVEFYKIALPFVENVPVQQLPMLPRAGLAQVGGHVIAGVECVKCGQVYKLQADFGGPQALEGGAEKFPKDCMLTCKRCGTIIDLAGLKLQIETRLGQTLAL